MGGIISLKQMQKKELAEILQRIDSDQNNNISLKGKYLGCAFYQPSTRTRLSFELAMKSLGGDVVGFSDMKTSRCEDNYFNETLKDFSQVMEAMVDVLVVRHPEDTEIDQMSSYVSIPIVNAGGGLTEHPVQAIQDIWLMNHKKSLENTVVGFLGDLSRNHRSIIYGLKHFPINKILFKMAEGCRPPQEIEAFLSENRIDFDVSNDIMDFLAESDHINSFCPTLSGLETRYEGKPSQFKRHKDCIIDSKKYRESGSEAYILNAGPRTYEVHTDMDTNPKFLFIEQVKAGLKAKRAVLNHVIDKYNHKSNLIDNLNKNTCVA